MMNSVWASKLFKRSALILVSVFFLTGLVYVVTSSSLSQYALQQVQTQAHLNVATTLIEDHQLVKQGQLNQQAIEQTFHRYMLLNPKLQIYLLDKQGNILKFAADAKKIKHLQVDIQPIQTFLNRSDNTQTILGDDPRSLTIPQPFSVAKLPINSDSPMVYLYVVIKDSIEAESNRLLQESLFLELAGYAFLLSLVIGLGLTLMLFHKQIQRLTQLSNSVSVFKKDLNTPISTPVNINDELDQLHADVSDLSQQIGSQLQQIEENSDKKRFMLSSLSHDLRTPLTNLLGYIEQTAKTQQNDIYLDKAYENGLKLQHYLDQLFDFAKLDMHDFQLQKMELSFSEFCFDLCSRYQQASHDWQLNIDQNHLYCFDPIYLERAIGNLLKNAKRYGEGQVKINLTQTDDWIIIEVCNQGKSLQSKLRHLQTFEAFAIENCQGTGPGLSITDAIVTKHGGQLRYLRRTPFNCFEIRLPN